MKDYMAPMEGITNYIYRNAYHKYYHPMDKYFTPFISAKPNKRLSFKEINEVCPETNSGLPVVPQILTNNQEDFILTANIMKEEYGHREVNLNLGCPSGTVTAKGKGAGFLGEPEKLRRFLDGIFSGLDMEISIKTRIGTDYEDDWEYLMSIYEEFPVKELIIHPRIQKDYYKNTPRLHAFRKAQEYLHMPICYNGDLFSPEDYKRFTAEFPETHTFMYGRGLIANPGLVSSIREGTKPLKKTLRDFHDEIYSAYRELLSGERNVLFRMKELWNYMCPSFSDYEKYAKRIKKSQRLSEYEAAVECLFSEQELVL
ncbi:MAG: tRNA-dihydrouridine synthase family protein [Eubacteriales bacterium]|nr:tRNA-dihydrouridine synthase family protein [Eubacteriales bacterium]